MSFIDMLSENVRLPSAELKKYILTCPRRYKIYTIPKRNGEGVRTIAQPSAPVKSLQREAVRILEDYAPVHQSATAYRTGVSILDNAAVHSKNAFLLKMDFSDFFPSIHALNVIQHLRQYCGFISDDDVIYLLSLIFRRRRSSDRFELSIGAPSSPFISNTFMYSFDCALSKILADKNIAYTRYADDLSFSTTEKDALFSVPDIVKKQLDCNQYNVLKINHKKTIFSSKKHNRHVTGLVLSNDGRVTIGRDRKREIKTLVFLFTKGELDFEKKNYLKGLLAHAKHIEPLFWSKIKRKYGLSENFFKQ
ncbi:retron St85 family RNA-directed DNA polymerase [Marinobacter salsuginis]|uniref:retron St85 family RNA-directed DNA polymerase n=1 Tax=Marinobacter salsuginis TaxID=418719 RepID=UPI00273F8544|nr:retron St85 family RNA-directed DNA polymerase [Marinobacter salsuginis]